MTSSPSTTSAREIRTGPAFPDGPMEPAGPGRNRSLRAWLSRGGTIPPAAGLCAFLSSLTLGSLLPILMVLANKSAPATLGAAALLANVAALLAGQGRELRLRYAALLASPVALVVVAVLALCAASFAWTIDPGFTRRGLVEGIPGLAFALAVAAAWPLVARRGDFLWLIVGLLGAAALIVFENRAGMPLHALIRSRGEAWDLKRSAIPPVLMVWPAITYCVARGRPLLALGLYASALVGVLFSHSGSAAFALGAGAASYVLARFAPKLAVGLFALGMAALILMAPWSGTIASRFMPAEAESALSEEHAAHRLQIWNAFEVRAHDRPILGHGFDTSFKVSTAPHPGGIPPGPEDHVIMNLHPHNIFLQFWVEFGVLGAMAAAAAAAFVLKRLTGFRAGEMAARLGLLASVVAIGLVGLSAWQPWWLASIATALIWFAMLDRLSDQSAGH